MSKYLCSCGKAIDDTEIRIVAMNTMLVTDKNNQVIYIVHGNTYIYNANNIINALTGMKTITR